MFSEVKHDKRVCFLQCWEYGIPLCRELAFQYESLYDYQSLSWIRVRCSTPQTGKLQRDNQSTISITPYKCINFSSVDVLLTLNLICPSVVLVINNT